MISPGGIVPTPSGGGLGVVLSVRDIAQGQDGQTLQQYRVRRIAGSGDPGGQAALGPAATGTAGAAAGAARLVDPRSLTLAQAQTQGVSAQEYLAALRGEGNGPKTVGGAQGADGQALNQAERAEVARLTQRDQAVRQEEKAHAAAAGGFASAPQYQTVTGPDGKQYAVAGQVNLRANVTGTPEQVGRAAAALQGAALAANAPSAQDMAVFRNSALQQGAARADATDARIGTPQDRSEFADAARAYGRNARDAAVRHGGIDA